MQRSVGKYLSKIYLCNPGMKLEVLAFFKLLFFKLLNPVKKAC